MRHAWVGRKLLRGCGTLLATAAILLISLLYADTQRPQEEAVAAAAPSGALVVVDAGHGGADGGSVGKAGTVEAPLNLLVAGRVEQKLLDAGFRVIMTREDEQALGGSKKADMAARRALLNTPDAALCVSVHMNAVTDSAIRGPMAFYMKGSKEGERLAQAVIDGVCTAVEWPLRGANPGDYFVVRECACPAVLIECGFLSNAADEKLLCDPAYQEKLAAGIVQGVLAYLDADLYNKQDGIS